MLESIAPGALDMTENDKTLRFVISYSSIAWALTDNLVVIKILFAWTRTLTRKKDMVMLTWRSQLQPQILWMKMV